MIKTYLLFVFLIGNALAFGSSKTADGPLDVFMKKVGFGLYKLDRKICDAQDDIEEIKAVLKVHNETLAALETGQEDQNGRLNALETVTAENSERIFENAEDILVLQTKTAENTVGISENADDILVLQAKDVSLMNSVSELESTVGEVGSPSTGLVLDVEVLQAKDMSLMTSVSELEDQNCLLQVKLEMLTAAFNGDGPILSCPEYSKDCAGDDLPGQPITELGDWEPCAEECRITSGCKYWTYVPVDDNCWLKSACNGLTGAADMFSGHRSCKQCFEECDASNHYLLDAYSRRVANDVREFEDVEDSSNDVPTSPDWVDNGPHWYKFDDNSRMHETNTDYPACGGYYVIRLSGTHPTEIGQYSAIFKDDGGNPYEGKMTNCGEFFVYLLPDTMNESRYCSDFV